MDRSSSPSEQHFENEVHYNTLPQIFEQFTPFEIPAYQRGYAWDDINVHDLKNDIEDLQTSPLYEHFTGTIVLIKEHPNKPGFSVIDGQQRLTSLFILIKAIYDKTHNEELYEKYIVIKERFDQKSRLKQVSDVNNYFEEYIIRGNLNADATIFAHQRIKSAKNIFDNWLRNKSNDEISRILEIIENRLRFIVYIPQNAFNASAMFEIINNRGKKLSELEKIKNYFVYIATLLGEEHRLHSKIKNSWEKMLQYLNYAQIHTLDEENSFLRFCFITFFNASKAKYQQIYITIKEVLFPQKSFINGLKNACPDELNKKIDKLQGFLDFLAEAAKNYACLLQITNFDALQHINDFEQKKKLKTIIQYLACHTSTASITPLYFSIMCRADIDVQTRINLLETLEKLNFRMFVLPKILLRSDNGQPELFELAHNFYEKAFDADELTAKLIAVTEKWCPFKRIVSSLIPGSEDSYDYAGWRGLRYFLGRYEEALQQQNHKTFDMAQIAREKNECQSGDFLSVEHIWARKNRLQYAAEDCFPKRRLGNFVLLELRTNIQIGNNDIEEKLKLSEDIENRIEIFKTSLYQGLELAGIFNTIQEQLRGRRKTKGYYWQQSNSLAAEREKKLIDFALKTWWISDQEKENANKPTYVNKLLEASAN